MNGRMLLSRVWTVGLILALMAGLSPVASLAGRLPAGPHLAQADEAREQPHTAALDAGWWASVQEQISTAEYAITWQEQTYLADLPAAYQAPNRAHNLRTYFSPDGPIVIPRTWAEETGVSPWRLEMALLAWGRAGVLEPVSPATLEALDNRIDYRRGQLVEWYRNDENGLKQGFTLLSPPAQAEGPLQLDLALRGDLVPRLNEAGTTVEFEAPVSGEAQGRPVLRYSSLAAVDAAGQSLPAWLRLGEDGMTLSLIVDDAGAAYPIEVDPHLTGLPPDPDWSCNIGQEGASLGESVATAGDVNADGYSDIVVGVPLYDGGQNNEGLVLVFYGSASGLGPSPARSLQRDQTGAFFGASVATAGDVDGDGDTEVIVGAPGWDDGEIDEGGVWVYYGSPSGLSTSPGEYYRSYQAGAQKGFSVSTAGDVNGDGYADIIVGAPYRSYPEEEEGWAFVYSGSASGLSNSPTWYAQSNQAGGGVGHGARLGVSVATAGDVNGDGYADVIVGALYYDEGQADEGKAFVWHGSKDGPNGGVDGTPANADWSAQLNQVAAGFGASVSTAGDVNSDGYADVLVGAPYYTNGHAAEGAARLYLGSATGLDPNYDNHDEGNSYLAQFGDSVSTAGDVNGDGYADVIVGAPGYANGEEREGRAFLWYGSADGIHEIRDWYDEGDAPFAWYGDSVATAGDVNGDGYSDIIVGMPGDTADAGSAFVYYGGPDKPETTAGWTSRPTQEYALWGYSVASAGDVNADGYADVVIGAPGWDGGQEDEGRAVLYLGSANGLGTTPAWSKEPDEANATFGGSVGTAGDVNGDGYDDVIVGAPYKNAGGLADRGQAWVYLGNSSGLGTWNSWQSWGDHVGALFGWAVGTAGDVNGDGYADWIVGAPYIDAPQTREGQVRVYYGSASALPTAADWQADGDQANAWFGYSVGTAGDVNRDGYSDVIVGEPMHSGGSVEAGRAYVYYGGPGGMSQRSPWHRSSQRNGSHSGISVGTAGDVNGDGYADIIIGAPDWDGGQENEGVVFIHHGSASGPLFNPALTEESNQAYAQFGGSVGTAGDVNGDGYADVIVGAIGWDGGLADEGGAWVYYGSASGVDGYSDWHAQGEQAQAHFGKAVASAGDVNGDGYADVIVGAPDYDYTESGEGQAFVFHGNGGHGAALALQQLTAAAHPIAQLGLIEGNNFLVSMQWRNPFGRGRAAAEIETKPLGIGADGQDTVISSWMQPRSGMRVNLPASHGLPVGMPYHWRLRLLYDPATTPFMPASRWVTIPWNGWNETDLRTHSWWSYLPLVLRNY